MKESYIIKKQQKLAFTLKKEANLLKIISQPKGKITISL